MELGQPLSILDVCLAAWDRLDVPGVDQGELEALGLKYVPGRFPVNPGALHRHLFHAQILQPLGQAEQIRVVGCEATQLAPIGRDRTPNQHLLVHIQCRAPLPNQPQHAAPPLIRAEAWAGVLDKSEFPLRAHLQNGAATCLGACRTTAQVWNGLPAPKSVELSAQPTRHPIFIGPGGGPGAGIGWFGARRVKPANSMTRLVPDVSNW